MRTRPLGVLLTVMVAGCGGATDPCDGVTGGVCLTARVEGAVVGLDQLRITVEGLPNSIASPSTPQGFSLPVKLAIIFPAGFSGTKNLQIDGLAAAMQTATTGKVSISIPATGKFAKTFTLVGGGSTDLAGGSIDMGGSDAPPPNAVSVSPPSFTFPATPRGTLATVEAVFTLTNTTTAMVTGTPTSTGDMNSFNPDATQTTCAFNANMTFTVPASSSCTVALTFKPAKSGALEQDVAVAFSNGMSGSIIVKGVGTPVWARESVSMGGPLEAVWGSSATDLYAVGHDGTGNGIFHSSGDGNWTACASPPAILRNVFSIAGKDSSFVLIGMDNGSIYSSTGNCSWTSMSTANAGWPASSSVRGLFVDPVSKVSWAVTDTGFVASSQPGSGSWNQFTANVGVPTTLYAAFGPESGVVGWVGMQASMQFAQGVAGGTLITLPNSGNPGALHGLWGTPPNLWAVGDMTSILRYDYLAMTTPTREMVIGPTGALTSISGRIDPSTTKPDIYVVGYLGNQLIHSTGDGTWTSISLPDNQGNVGVWVATTGEVIVAGTPAPTIQHLY